MVGVTQFFKFLLPRHKKTHSAVSWYNLIVSFQDGKRSVDNLTRKSFIFLFEYMMVSSTYSAEWQLTNLPFLKRWYSRLSTFFRPLVSYVPDRPNVETLLEVPCSISQITIFIIRNLKYITRNSTTAEGKTYDQWWLLKRGRMWVTEDTINGFFNPYSALLSL